MGANSSVEIRVSFDRPDLFYFAGESVSGNISLQHNNKKLSIDKVYLELIGELGYMTQGNKQSLNLTKGHGQNEHHIETRQIPFVTCRVPVIQPQYGQREITLYRGQHSWPFEFILPQCLPPSSVPSTTSYPYVRYYTRLVLDKPWYKFNAEHNSILTIFPHVNLYQIQAAQQIMPFSKSNRKKVQLNGYIFPSGVIRGEILSLDITFQNPKRYVIKKIKAKLIQHFHIGESHHQQTIFQMNLPDLLEFNEIEFHRTFDLQIPSMDLAPTYTYRVQCCDLSTTIDYRYELELEVKVRGLFTNFVVCVPVIIGTEPISNQQQSLTNNFVETTRPSAPVFDYNEPPPAYDSMATNIKQ